MPSPSTPCARCPRLLGVSCCEVKQAEQLVTLTWADVARLGEATGRNGEASTEWEWLDEAAATQWAGRHPRWANYFGPTTRRLTLRREGGACVFHRPAGCTLRPEQRPTGCRLYPFELRADGQWGLQVDRFGSVEAARASGEHACLAVEEADSFETLWAALATDGGALEALAQRLEREVREHGQRERATQKGRRRALPREDPKVI